MIGTRLMDRYELLGELGRGGMGVVYRASDPLLGREVAIKIFSASHSSGLSEERFRREAQLVAQLDHPAIVPIYDFGRHGDSLFFVMPVLRGQTLYELIHAGTLNLGDTLEIVARVAEALDYSAHQGVIHRDVKPENVMVARQHDGEMRVWVMDFGLALEGTSSRITKTGHLPGTLPYLSPEYVLSLDLDGRADLYSLGTILYECLAGEPPFVGAQGSVLYRIVNEPPPSLAARGIDEELDRIVQSCLAKEPGERPRRGRELATALRRYRDTLSDSVQLRVLATARTGDGATAQDPPLIGRERELAELQQRLSAALQGECQLALVGGEVGTGKTRLLQELEVLARGRGVRVAWGRFSGQEGTFPHHGFCELIQECCRTFEGRAAESRLTEDRTDGGAAPDLGDLAADLQLLFPVLSEIREIRDAAAASRPRERSGAVHGGDRTLVFELLARTLIRLAAGAPAVFLLENLHAAEGSIEALQYVVRRLGPTPILVVGSYRSGEVSRRHPLAQLIKGFEGDPRFVALTLGPLSPEDHLQLVISHVAGRRRVHDPRAAAELAARLYEVTEGNPFFTRELVRSLVSAGEITCGDSESWTLSEESAISADHLPETIQQVVEARLERLPEELLSALSAASVLGRSFDVRDLAGLIEDPEAAEEAVEQLTREGILEEERRSRGDQLLFTSGVVRDVLHGNLTRRRRRALHRRHAEQLEKRHAGRLERVYPQLVYHFSQGDVAVKAVTYALMLARMSAGAFSPLDTIRATRTALEFVEDYDLDGSGEVEGELRLLLAAASRTVGNFDGALKEAVKALAALEQAGELTAAAGAALVAAEIAWQVRKLEDNRRFLAKGIDLARATGARSKLRELLTFAATVANLRGEHQRARAFLDEVEALAPGAVGAGGEAPRVAGGTLRVAFLTSLTIRDPAWIVNVEDAEVLCNVFETLLDSDADGNPIPRLAAAWSFDDSGTVLTMTLRTDVRFSDGAPVSAAAVRRSLERTARCSARMPPAFHAPALRALHGFDAYLAGEAAALSGVEVMDEHTLRFHLVEPLPLFPLLLSDPHTAITHPGEGGEVVGSGPFQLEATASETDTPRVTLLRNPRSWRTTPPFLDRIEIRAVSDAAAIASGLRAGELDLVRDLLPHDLEEVLRDPDLRDGLVEAPKKNVYFVLFNRSGPLTHEPRLRRVLAGAVRVQDVVWRTLGRFAQPATCFIPPGILGHDPGRRRSPCDRAEAGRLLAEAGLVPPIRLRAASHPLFIDRYATFLEALLNEWASCGIEVEIESAPRQAFLTRWASGEGIDLLLTRWIPDYDDPDNLTYVPFHSRDGAFKSYLALSKLDRLLERARHEERPGARQMFYRKAENLLTAEDALLPLFHEIDYRITGPRVRGVRCLGTPPFVDYADVSLRAPEDGGGARPLPESGALRVPLPTSFDSLEPSLALYVEPAEVVPNVFETLTRVEEGARIAPCLAAEFKSEEGGRRVRFHLRTDVRFHDGRRLTARDVRYSFERLLRAPYPGVESVLLPIRGARDFRTGKAAELAGVSLVSAHELVIELDPPLAFFPAMLTNPIAAIVPEGTTGFAGNWRQGCAGTGPFRVVHFEPGDRIELEANPHYWRAGFPKSRQLVFELGVAPDRMLAQLRAGRFAVACGLPPPDVETLRQDKAYAAGLRESPGFSTYFLVMNSRRGPFADPALRQAFRAALDVEGLVRTTLGRLALPAQGLISAGLLGHETAGKRPPAAAGDRRQLAGVELRVSVHPAYTGQYGYVWSGLQEALAGLGVRCRTASKSMPEILREVEAGEVDLVAARRIAAYPDADAFVSMFHSRDGLLGKLLGHPEVDRLIERGRLETDPVLRHVTYRELEEVLARDALMVPLFDEQIYCFARPEIEGLRIRLGWPKVAYEELSRRY